MITLIIQQTERYYSWKSESNTNTCSPLLHFPSSSNTGILRVFSMSKAISKESFKLGISIIIGQMESLFLPPSHHLMTNMGGECLVRRHLRGIETNPSWILEDLWTWYCTSTKYWRRLSKASSIVVPLTLKWTLPCFFSGCRAGTCWEFVWSRSCLTQADITDKTDTLLCLPRFSSRGMSISILK